MSGPQVSAIEAMRLAEKAQAMFYRRLAALAEVENRPDEAQRLHDLHADEQHHLSRLSALLIEMGETPADVGSARAPEVSLEGWEEEARRREQEEVDAWERFLAADLDAHSRALAESIIEVERLHRDQLGGKWTMA